MSYILDALKKSEQERNLGKTPDISSNHEVLHRGVDYRNWILIAAVILILVLVSTAGFFYIHLLEQETQNAQEKIALEKKLHDAKLNELQILKRQMQEERQGQSLSKSFFDEESQNATKLDGEEIIANEYNQNGLEIIRPNQERRDQLQQTIQNDAIRKESLKKEYEQLFDEAGPSNEQAEALDSQASVEQLDNEPLWENYPAIGELDGNVQAEIPPLKVTTHIFSSVESFRKVTLNEKVLREGEALNENISIQHILDNGVIIKFDDIVFRMKLLEEWEGFSPE